MKRSERLQADQQHQINVNPPKELTPYQWAIYTAPWYRDDLKAWTDTFVKSRRVGGSEVLSLRCISFALGREMQPNGHWIQRRPMSGIIVSKDFFSAKETIEKVHDNCLELGKAGDRDYAAAEVSATKVYFPTTGTTIRALASTGRSIRGGTGFAGIDEFAHVRNQEELWGAVKPLASPTLGNKNGFPILMVTTAWESGTLAHRLFTDDAFKFRRHSVDIYQAVAEGFPIVPEEAFAELGIPELVETEYLCLWSRGGESYFPSAKLRFYTVDDGQHVQISDTEDELRDSIGLPEEFRRSPHWYGIDVGGGVGRDFTAVVQWTLIGDEYWVTAVRAFNHLDVDEQIDNVVPWIRSAPGEVRVDRGSMGISFIQMLRKRLTTAGIRVTGQGMVPAEQEVMVNRFKRLLEAGQMKIYLGTAAGGDAQGADNLIRELAQMKARRSGDRLKIETPKDVLKGHCDRAWAAIIGLMGSPGRLEVAGSTGGYRPAVNEIDIENTPIGFG